MKTYISNYPNISTIIKRYVDLDKVTFLLKAHKADDRKVILQFEIFHETPAGEPLKNLDEVVELIASDKELVYSRTGEYLEYEPNKTVKNVSTKGVPVGEFTFFQGLKKVPIVIDTVVLSTILRGDNLKYLNNYIKK